MGYRDPGHRDQIKAMIEYARKIAVAQRRHTCVVIDASSNLTLSSELVTPESHAGACPYTVLHLPVGGDTLLAPKNVTVTPPLTIEFNAEGIPVGAFATTTISVQDNSGGTTSTSTLIVQAGSGYVH